MFFETVFISQEIQDRIPMTHIDSLVSDIMYDYEHHDIIPNYAVRYNNTTIRIFTEEVPYSESRPDITTTYLVFAIGGQ